MRLFYSKTSPYSAKVRMAAHHCGIALESVLTDTSAEPPELLAANPLGKIPTLVLDGGETVYDSVVIVDYLDRMSGNLLIPQTTEAWLQARRTEALADGVVDAAILIIYEARFRPEAIRHQPWIDRQWRKASRGLAALEKECAALPPELSIAHFALAALLGWLRLRFSGQWETDNPTLAAWLDRFTQAHPDFADMLPQG